MKIFIIGAGIMGSGIAQVFAEKGFRAFLCDIENEFVEKGYLVIEKNLTRLVKKELITEARKNEIISNIKKTVDKNDAKDCGLIIEAVVENIDVKKTLFKELEKIADKNAILATNTSSLSITEIASTLTDPGRLVGIHFFNPAPLMKLVEIVRGKNSRSEVVERAINIIKELDKEHVVVKDSCGFIVNRLLMPMINDAAGVLAEGIASAEDIDKAMQYGANHPIGPLSLADLIGNDIVLAIMNNLYKEFGDTRYKPHPLLEEMVRKGHLGRKSSRGFFEY